MISYQESHCPAATELKPATVSFLTWVARLSQKRPASLQRLWKTNIAFLTSPEAILQAARLEKQGVLSRQCFTHDLMFPILGEGMFSSDEAGWKPHKQTSVRYLKPSRNHLPLWKGAARRAAQKALASHPSQVDGIRFCRGIAQEALLEAFFGTPTTEADRKRLYRLAHRMDTMAEMATFFMLVLGRNAGLALARPFQKVGVWARKRLEEQIERMEGKPGYPAEEAAFREELRTLLFAGQDTTGTALAFVLWMLGAHPDVQEEIRQEVLACGADSEKLEQAVLETLRLLPPVHTPPPRTAMQATEIGGVPVPKGTKVIYSLWFAHRRCERPEEFIPQRFENGTAHKHSFPFGVGPKHCVGEHLAMTVLKEAVAEILSQRRIQSPTKQLVLGARTVLVPRKLKFRLEPI